MNKKYYFTLIMIGLVSASSVFAQDTKKKTSAPAVSAWGTGVVTGIAGVKAVRSAGAIKNASFSELVNTLKSSSTFDEKAIQKAVAPIESGDEIVVKLQYNEFRNREAWIKTAEEKVSGYRGAAKLHDSRAETAMKTAFDVGSDGYSEESVLIAKQVPNLRAREVHKLNAKEARKQAAKWEAQLARVRSGVEKAPIMKMERKFRPWDKVETKAAVKNLLQDEVAAGSKVYYVSRVSKSSLAKAKLAKNGGRALIGVAIFSTVWGTWEYFNGDVAKYLDSKGFRFSYL